MKWSLPCVPVVYHNTSFAEHTSPVPGIPTIHMPATSNPAKTSWGWERKYGLANQWPGLGSWHYEPSRQAKPNQIKSRLVHAMQLLAAALQPNI